MCCKQLPHLDAIIGWKKPKKIENGFPFTIIFFFSWSKGQDFKGVGQNSKGTMASRKIEYKLEISIEKEIESVRTEKRGKERMMGVVIRVRRGPIFLLISSSLLMYQEKNKSVFGMKRNFTFELVLQNN